MMEGQLQKAGLQHRKKSKAKAPPQPGSDSEASGDSNSNSGDSQAVSRSGNDRHKSVTKKGEWEILSGLKQGQRFEFTPNKFEGNLLKRRKWPLNGWHKRYFVLENSILTYAKNAAELSRGKKHGSMDIGMSVISTKAARRRIDIDADTSIVHLKCQSREVYLQWVEQLKQHRLRKQHQLLYCSQPSALPNLLSPLSPSDDSPTEPLSIGGAGSLTGTLPGSLPGSLPGTLGRDAKPLSSAANTAELKEERGKCSTGRRSKLPVPQPNKEDFSLFKFLCKNIGKDLSKVSLPITINEPLNMLQRLCEELEYSELLEKAASLRDPAERMIQVAAFAVSAYASSIHRAAHKAFNPLLGETYECIREDKGFKFVAEQVSHHPPVSACHAQGSSFTLWQDVRIKTKFWGKSLEFQPSGTVHLTLHQHNDVYEWNKVTSCVHNLFGGGTRWVDQYGEAVITNAPHGLTCRLTFVKASGGTSKRHEVLGSITDESGAVLHSLFGRWTEALYCGHAPSARVVWRPGSMPDDARLYYGFTRFAIELNELLPEQRHVLPPTDSRFRPDQRLLEEGRIADAEASKQALELEQRERRKQREAEGTSHVPMWFRREDCHPDAVDESTPEETWKFNNEYWNKRKDPGFANMSFEPMTPSMNPLVTA